MSEAAYWADLRAEEMMDRMRDEADERAAHCPEPDEPPPVFVGTCAAPGCAAPVWEDGPNNFVGHCPHWDPEEPQGEEADRIGT